MYDARLRSARLRAARRRDRAGRRHPRRARPGARQAPDCGGDRRLLPRRDPQRHAAVGRPRGPRERDGWHAVDRALPRLQRGQPGGQGARREDHALARRQLHHGAGHDRRLDHGRAPHPGPDQALGRSGGDAGAAVGSVADGMEKVLLVDVTTVRNWVGRIATDLEVNKDLLTQLDSAIGDADHGINMVRGFTAVTAALQDATPGTPGELLVLVGKTLISKVGGASGPLYGTAFRRAGKALGAAPDISADALGTALAAALEGVQGLGAAAGGDKTMVDALAPAVRAYHQAQAAGASIADAASAAARAAAVGAE